MWRARILLAVRLLRYCADAEAALSLSALFVPPPRLCSRDVLASCLIYSDFSPVRVADPAARDAAIVVEDGNLVTAQGGGDPTAAELS